MDVKHGRFRAALLALTLFLVHCGDDSKHQGFVTASSACQSLAQPTRYVVHWKSGATSLVEAQNQKDFLNNYFATHRDEIAWAEHDFNIKLSEDKSSQPVRSGLPSPDWGLERIGADKVWAQGVWGEEVTVAVIDTGMDIEHIKLRDSVYTHPHEVFDGTDTDGNGYIDDVHGYDFIRNSGKMVDERGHGTHVAGIIAGDHIHGLSRGVAPAAKVLPLRTIGTQSGSAAKAAEAVGYAVDRGAQIINASWGGIHCSQTLLSALRALEGKDVLFVTAAGNDFLSLDHTAIYPAVFGLPHQLTVGASGPNDLMTSFSNYSPTKVHLLAPGFFIWSTSPNNREKPEDGTSMSAPFVSGAAALLKSAYPHASMLEIRQALLDGVDPPPVIGSQVDYPVVSGGRLNVWRSYQLLLRD